MATVTVKNGNYGSYLYIDYSFSKNTSARTWSLSASLNLVVPSGYTFGPWDNYYAHSANLEGNGIPSLTGGTHTLDTWSTSGNYNANGDAPSVSISWAFNVRSSWGGYWEEYGSITATGESITPDGTPPTGLTATLVESGPDWADISMSISSWGSPSTSATRYIEAAVLGTSTYGNPYKYKTATAVMSATLHVDNTCSGNLTITPNTQYYVGGYATNQTRNASTVGAAFTTLPAVPVIAAVDQGHGVIDFAVTHANEGSAQTVAEEYSTDGGTTWTAISGGAFSLTLSSQTEVIARRTSSAGASTASITVAPQFDVGIYGSASDKTVAIRKVYAPIMAPKLVSASITPSQYTTALDSEKFVGIFTEVEAFRKEIMQGATLAQLTLDWASAQVIITITLSNGHVARVVAESIASLSTRYGITATRPSGGTDTVALTGAYVTASLSKKVAKNYVSVNRKTKLVYEDPS